MFPRECRTAWVGFFDVDVFVFKQMHYRLLQRDQTRTPRHTLHPAPAASPSASITLQKSGRGGWSHRGIDSSFYSPQEYQIDIIFAQTWVDTRLRYNSSSTRMPTLTLNR